MRYVMNSFMGKSFLSFQCLCIIFLGVVRFLATDFKSFLRNTLQSEVSGCKTTKLLLFFLPSFSLFFHDGCCFVPEYFNFSLLSEYKPRVTLDITTAPAFASTTQVVCPYRQVLRIPSNNSVQMQGRFNSLEDL